jgi:flagellar biosynthetic protein FliR
MDPIGPIAWHIVPFLLVVTRLGGLFVFTPLLANRGVPRRGRAMLALALGAAVYAGVPAAARAAPDVGLFVLPALLLSELLIGVAIGFVASLPIMAMDVGGFIIGHQMGLGLARAYNPDADVDTEILGQLLMYLGLGAFLALGGLEAVFLALAHTFERVPPGAFAVDRLPVSPLVGVLTGGFELAIRVSAPSLAIIVLLLIAMGFVSKTMPQINVMSVGFTVKIVFGLLILAASLAAIQQAAGDHVADTLRQVADWGRTMR